MWCYIINEEMFMQLLSQLGKIRALPLLTAASPLSKEYGFSEEETIKHRDVEDFLMIDIILDPFIDKFKLEW